MAQKEFSVHRVVSKRQIVRKLLFIFGMLFLCVNAAFAIGGGDGNPDLKTPQDSLKRWRSLRVGVFVHWTPYVLASRQPSPAEGYNNFYKKFKGEHFDPNEWIRTLKKSGFKYMVQWEKYH